MTLNSYFKSMVSAAALTALTGPALALEDATVRELTVIAESTDAQDSNALRYYPEISGDVNAAIYERIEMDDDPNGYIVTVNLGNISLDGDTELPDNLEFNQMEGMVIIASPETNAPVVTYPVKVFASTADTAVPPGYTLVNPGTDDFYNAMVVGFAEQVEDMLPEAMREASSR